MTKQWKQSLEQSDILSDGTPFDGANIDAPISTSGADLRFIGGFELSLASFILSFDVSGQDGSPRGVVFSADGTAMFVVGNNTASVYQYALTSAFDISTASFTGSSFDVSGQDGSPLSVVFSADGTAMFVVGGSTNSVYQYSLSTAFDISTASFTGSSFDVSGQASIPRGVVFSDDGTAMFVVGSSTDQVYQYALTSAFDISTASFTGTSFDVSGQDGSPRGVVFSADGTAMFVVGNNTASVYQYALTSAFDISTASFTGTSFDVSGEDGRPTNVVFSADGTAMFVVGTSAVRVHQYLVGEVGPE